MQFNGYERADGSVGVRNHVLILAASNCANQLVSIVADKVKGTLALTHDHECARCQPDTERAKQTLVGIGSNPNMAATLVVGLGCDHIPALEIFDEIAQTKKPVELVTLDREGGFQETIDKCIDISQRMSAKASEMKRKPFALGHLNIGVKCTGTHPMSPMAGHQAVSRAFDAVVDAGGYAMFSETAELIGAEHILAKRAASEDVAKRLHEMVDKMETEIRSIGVDIRGTQPNRGNIKSGISTLEEKSLSGIVKTGTVPLQGVLEYAERPKESGLYFMDGTAQTSQLFAGMVAAGSQILLLSVGGGTPALFRNLPGFAGWPPISPVIKLLSSPGESREASFFDVYAGTIVEGKTTADEMGERLVQKILSIASGEPTKTEEFSNYQEPLAMYTTGSLL